MVDVEVPPGRRMKVWNGVCLETPESEWIYYYGVTFTESLGLKGVLFVSVTK